MSIEQAIFTSARSGLSAGYSLIARSPGISDADARELTAWGPSHDSLIQTGGSSSTNCFTLNDGRMCISRTVAAGDEYSGRGGARIYTQFLVPDAEIAVRFACNPFAILRAASAKGLIRVMDNVHPQLASFSLSGRARTFDPTMLIDLHSTFGSTMLAALIDHALRGDTVALVACEKPDLLLHALLNLLPIAHRQQLSFSTGLKHSLRRPFKWFVVSNDKAEHRQLERQHQVTVIDLSQPVASSDCSEWAQQVVRAAETGNTVAIAAAIEAPALTGLFAGHGCSFAAVV